MLGRGKFTEELNQPALAVENFACRDRSFRDVEARQFLEVVANENALQRQSRHGHRVVGDVGIKNGDDLGDHGLVVNVSDALKDLRSHRNAGLQALSGLEVCGQANADVDLGFLIKDGLGFLERHGEVAVLLHLGAGNFPPLFPIAADDILQHNLDLVSSG